MGSEPIAVAVASGPQTLQGLPVAAAERAARRPVARAGTGAEPVTAATAEGSVRAWWPQSNAAETVCA